MGGVRLLIADDHPLVLEALSMAARTVDPALAVDTAGTVGEAMRLARARADYSLALLDLLLPDTHGFSGLMQLQNALPAVPIAIVTAHRRPELVEVARALGAAGFLLKSQPLDRIAGGIRDMLAGRPAFPAGEAAAPRVADVRSRLEGLSVAQRRVLFALADGRLNKQIAGDLGVTEGTIKAHLTVIFRKLGVLNRTQALLAIQPLLGEPEPVLGDVEEVD